MNRDLINVALNETKAAAGETYKFPESIYKHIAFRMVKENHLEDDAWLKNELNETQRYITHKRELAQKGGYAPFTFLGKTAYNWIRKNCAEWVIPAMAVSFRDSEDIHPEWAVQCAKTMSILGREECESQEDLYNYLIDHPEWEIQQDAREQYRREWLRLKKSWERKSEIRNRSNGQSNTRRQQSTNSGPARHDSDKARSREATRPQETHIEPEQKKTVSRNTATPAPITKSHSPIAAGMGIANNFGLVEAQTEVVLKFDTLPKGRPAYDRQFTNFELFANGRIVTVEVRRTFYDRLIKTTREGKKWIAVLSGDMGEPTAQGFLLTQPFTRMYPVANQEPQETEKSEIVEENTLQTSVPLEINEAAAALPEKNHQPVELHAQD